MTGVVTATTVHPNTNNVRSVKVRYRKSGSVVAVVKSLFNVKLLEFDEGIAYTIDIAHQISKTHLFVQKL